MISATTKYKLILGEKTMVFNSEKDACDYLGVKQCTVASCYRSRCLCKGYQIEKVGISTHNMTKTRLFKIWDGMKGRCERQNHKYYHNYGGRGIVICEEWKNNFESFHNWAASNGYKDNLTLDRIDVNGNYEPNNCRWITQKEQQRNKRTNHKVVINGIEMTVSEVSEKYNIPPSTIIWREKNNKDLLSGADMRGKSTKVETNIFDEEEIHGKWVDEKHINEYHCSECGAEAPNDGYDDGACYCYNCGAKMDGGDDDKGFVIDMKDDCKRAEILEKAKECICQDRDIQYGSPENSFERIAEYWSVYLRKEISAHDVGMMMSLFKMARIDTGHHKEDNYVDCIGYIACAGEIEQRIEKQ